MKYLFVGGPADGEWRETTGKDIVNVRSCKPFVAGKHDEFIELPVIGHIPKSQYTTRYLIRPWAAEGANVSLYVPEGTSDADTFRRLVRGYQPT